jgi:hypothetical protein
VTACSRQLPPVTSQSVPVLPWSPRSEADHCGIHLRDERRHIRDGDIIIADMGRTDIGGEYDGIVLSISHCNIPRLRDL